MARRKRRDPLRSLGATALGLGGLGVTVGVSAAISGKAGGSTAGFSQIAGGAGIAVPVIAGGVVLGQVRKLGKRKKRRRR